MSKKFKISFLGEDFRITPLVALVFAAVVLRIPTLFEPYWYGDEAIYLTLGQAARQGLVWYRDIFDHKPPLIYLLAALAGSIFWFRLILLFWHAATIVLFWKLAEALLGKNRRGIIASSAIFTGLTTIPLLEATIANSEIFMIGPTIAGLLLVLSAKKLTYKRVFSAGLLFSAATLFKVPAGLDMAALVFFWGAVSLWKAKEIWQAAKRSLVLGAGFLLPILGTVVYYWQQGALFEYLSTAWFFNFGYLFGWGVPTLPAETGGFEAGLFFRAQLLALVLLLLLVFKSKFNKTTLFAAIWFVFALFAMLLSGRPYPHYVVQVVPPLSLLVAILGFGQEKYRYLTLPFLLIFLVSLLFYNFGYYPVFSYYQNFLSFASGQKSKEQYFKSFDNRVARTYKLAQFLNLQTDPQERVFIWGTEPEVYALSRRLPPVKFVTSFHIGDLAAEEEVLRGLQRERPKYIIVIQGEKRPFPGFQSFLRANYIFLENIAGAEVWRLVSPQVLEKLTQ